MYQHYWQFERMPFENHCDSTFFFAGRSHEAALLKLQFLAEQSKGAALLVGGHGLGKTCITRQLENYLNDAFQPVVRLMFPRLSAVDTLAYLAAGLGARTENVGTPHLSSLWQSLEDRCTTLASDGKHPIFIIDDAHLIESPEVLECLSMVLNLSHDRGLGLSLILTGQPELLPQVQRVALLDKRISIRIGLHPLDAEETGQYVAHRLQVAGLEREIFAPDTYAKIADLSEGVPRRINQICDLALLVGYADRLDVVTRAEIEAAADELCQVSVD